MRGWEGERRGLSAEPSGHRTWGPRFHGRHEDPAGRAGSLGTLAQRPVPGEEGQGMPGISLGSLPLGFPKLGSPPACPPGRK